MTRIELRNLTKTYSSAGKEVAAVDNVVAAIEPGEFFFLLGPSGCGKTTLLRMIAGLIEPTRGAVLFDGVDVTWTSVEGRNTAMVFQNYALWPHMTVGQNVRFGPRMRGMKSDKCNEVVQRNLHRVQMVDYAARKPNQLSGGQQQRVALARALAANPACLLLDEPLSNLDARLRLHMRGQLRRIVKESGATTIYVTHDQNEALSMADRLAVMDRGGIVQIGTPQEVYHRPATRFVADFMGEANFIDGRIASTTGPGGVTCVVTPAGRIMAGGACGGGDAATCCVRPERVAILGAEDPLSNRYDSVLHAAVEADTFLGEIRQYVCRLDDDTRWKVTCLSGLGETFPEGGKVKLCFNKDDVSVLA